MNRQVLTWQALKMSLLHYLYLGLSFSTVKFGHTCIVKQKHEIARLQLEHKIWAAVLEKNHLENHNIIYLWIDVFNLSPARLDSGQYKLK